MTKAWRRNRIEWRHTRVHGGGWWFWSFNCNQNDPFSARTNKSIDAGRNARCNALTRSRCTRPGCGGVLVETNYKSKGERVRSLKRTSRKRVNLAIEYKFYCIWSNDRRTTNDLYMMNTLNTVIIIIIFILFFISFFHQIKKQMVK